MFLRRDAGRDGVADDDNNNARDSRSGGEQNRRQECQARADYAGAISLSNAASSGPTRDPRRRDRADFSAVRRTFCYGADTIFCFVSQTSLPRVPHLISEKLSSSLSPGEFLVPKAELWRESYGNLTFNFLKPNFSTSHS